MPRAHADLRAYGVPIHPDRPHRWKHGPTSGRILVSRVRISSGRSGARGGRAVSAASDLDPQVWNEDLFRTFPGPPGPLPPERPVLIPGRRLRIRGAFVGTHQSDHGSVVTTVKRGGSPERHDPAQAVRMGCSGALPWPTASPRGGRSCSAAATHALQPPPEGSRRLSLVSRSVLSAALVQVHPAVRLGEQLLQRLG